MRTAEHHGVHLRTAADDGRERALDLYAILERVEDVPILQPALLQVGASSELMLDRCV